VEKPRAVSRHLAALERAAQAGTLSAAAARLQETGLALVLVFVCLPFLQPVPMGGLSSVVGPFVILQGLQLARGRGALWVPDWIGRRRISARSAEVLLGAARALFRLTARFSGARLRPLARAGRAAGLGMVLCGAMLALPVPIPLSNIACAAPVVLWSLALLEDDGVFALLGWLTLAASLLFHAAIFRYGAEGLRRLLA